MPTSIPPDDTAAYAAPCPRRAPGGATAHVRDPADGDRRAHPVHQVEQRVRPPVQTVVHLAAEPAKFTLVTATGRDDTTNNGHLVLPEKIRPFSTE
jgi:hypothetical protein